MVAGLWSGIAQDEMCQMKNGLVFKKEEDFYLDGHLFSGSFLLDSWRCNQR
jgi:hypothetical protein